ncbi:unnamed protein product, partial [Bubo scandiacus]
MSEVLKYEQLLFGAAASTVNAYEKQKIWWRITNKINAAGRNQRDIGEVKNRWRGLRRRANDKITRHRQERQGPAARPAVRPGNGNGNGSGPGPPELGPGPAAGWGQRGAAGIDPPLLSVEVVAPHGVKEEAVKEEPVEVKTEPFPGPAADSVPGRGAERRLPRTGIRSPGELCEGWSRSPPRPAPPNSPSATWAGSRSRWAPISPASSSSRRPSISITAARASRDLRGQRGCRTGQPTAPSSPRPKNASSSRTSGWCRRCGLSDGNTPRAAGKPPPSCAASPRRWAASAAAWPKSVTSTSGSRRSPNP